MKRGFRVIDRNGNSHGFNKLLHFFAWRPIGEHHDEDDYKILDIFSRNGSDDPVASFPYPAAIIEE